MSDETPRFVTEKLRLRAFPLAWPFECGGKRYETVCLKRLTAGEVAAFQEAVEALPAGACAQWPIYCDVDGAPLPPDVLAALDDDDKFELDKAVRDFLPRRFQGALASASDQANGDSTASPSATSPTGA
ncbi:MAG: phage tail assembly protein [Roseiarcus sp.]|jgi:hypothetical protein